MGKKPNRDEAWALLNEWNKSEALIYHALAVEGVMRYFAKFYGEDEDKWGVIGLLHDLDYEKFPEQHCTKTKEILEAEGVDESYIRAIVSHGYGICSDVEPQSVMEKVLYTTDELTGLIYASALMRPSRSVMDMETKSVMKKYKTASFAAGVDRGVIARGSEMLGMPLSEVLEHTLLGMREVCESIGLNVV